jgi:hypothetical protein
MYPAHRHVHRRKPGGRLADRQERGGGWGANGVSDVGGQGVRVKAGHRQSGRNSSAVLYYILHLRESNPLSGQTTLQRRLAGGSQ